MLIVYNPRSSQFADVRAEVLRPAGQLRGWLVGKYEVAQTNIEDNIAKLGKLVADGDLVVAAGGDATGIVAVNAVLRSGKKATLAALPYGNFNDLSRTLGVRELAEAVDGVAKAERRAGEAAKAERVKFYPLEVYVDGKFWRWATCYVTAGMTAEAVKLYDAPEMRRKLRSEFGRKITSYTRLAQWYFRNRKGKRFLPECRLNGVAQDPRASDYAAVNGRYMARVMRGREDFRAPRRFRSEIDRLTNFWRLCRLMFKSIVDRVPGTDTEGDVLEFRRPATVEIQAEGESRVFKGVRKIEVRKSGRYFYAVAKKRG